MSEPTLWADTQAIVDRLELALRSASLRSLWGYTLTTPLPADFNNSSRWMLIASPPVGTGRFYSFFFNGGSLESITVDGCYRLHPPEDDLYWSLVATGEPWSFNYDAMTKEESHSYRLTSVLWEFASRRWIPVSQVEAAIAIFRLNWPTSLEEATKTYERAAAGGPLGRESEIAWSKLTDYFKEVKRYG